MTIDQMREKLKLALTEKRYNHSIGVMQTAVSLARLYGANANKTAVAALLHDCAKNYSKSQMLELCERFNVELDPVSKESTGLIHGFLGAVIADKYYGVNDSEIYDAIYYHTIGKPDMSLITKIIYIADYMEPNRDFEGLDELRRLSYKNIDDALLLGLEMSIEDMNSRGIVPHICSETAARWLKEHN